MKNPRLVLVPGISERENSSVTAKFNAAIWTQSATEEILLRNSLIFFSFEDI